MEKTGRQKTIKEKETALRQSMLTSGIFVSIIATYICLMAGAYQHDHVRIDFLDAVAGGIKMITKNPLYFWPIAPEAVVPTLGIVCIVICVMYLSYLLQRVRLHHDVNTLKGSSKWADLKEMLLKYAEFEDEKKKNYPVGRRMVEFLWKNEKERKWLWEIMKGE